MSDIDSDESDFGDWTKRVFKKKMIKVLDFAMTHDEATLQTYGKYRSLKSRHSKQMCDSFGTELGTKYAAWLQVNVMYN